MTHIPPVTYIENDYIFDEKRKTVVNLRSANPFQQYIYSRNYFKLMRPDLNAYDFLIWKDKFNLGDRYLNELRLRVNKEIQRFYHQHTLTERRNLGLLEENTYDLVPPITKGLRISSNRNWEDANKIVGLVDKMLRRLSKYALDVPNFKKEEYDSKQLENEVTDRFLREMRKPPKQEQVN